MQEALICTGSQLCQQHFFGNGYAGDSGNDGNRNFTDTDFRLHGTDLYHAL